MSDDKPPRQRCTARIPRLTKGGRTQCARMAKPGEAYCLTHLRQVERRLAEQREIERERSR